MSELMYCFVGASGSGKTFTMQLHARRAVKKGWKIVVIDLVEEWPNRQVWQRTKTEHTITEDWEAAARCVDVGRPLTVYRPEPGVSVPLAAERMAAAAIVSPYATIVCVPEANKCYPEGKPLGRASDDIAHRFRHKAVNARIWWDTQQLADVKKEMLAPMTRIHLFGGATMRDGGRVRGWGGKELEQAVQKCGQRAVQGQKGWHVAISPLNCFPPFKPIREKV